MFKRLISASGICLIATCLVVAGLTGCGQKKEVVEQDGMNPAGNVIKIAIGGMTTPKEGFFYYWKFLKYLEGKLGQEIYLVNEDSYQKINDLLEAKQLDTAFVCAQPYVDGHDKFGLELLVAPQVNGQTSYYSYIITNIDSPVKSFEELKGKTFVFTEPMSNTGKLVPTYMLAKMGQTPDSFFGKYVFSGAHDASIKMVAQKIADGAAVDSLIWDYVNQVNPEYTSQTKIIEKSPPYGIPPVVVLKNLDPGLKDRLRNVFLKAHLDADGRRVLEDMKIEKFVTIDDNAYDSVRQMKDWIVKQIKE